MTGKPDDISQDDWDAVDFPTLTDEQLHRMKPAKGDPRLAPLVKRGRPRSETPKRQITLRLDPDIVEHFKATGKGWQTRLNDTLRKAVLE